MKSTETKRYMNRQQFIDLLWLCFNAQRNIDMKNR